MRFTAALALFAIIATPALAMYGAEDIDARDLSYETIDARDFNYDAIDARDFGYDEIDARDFGYDEIDARDFGYEESPITARDIASAMVDILQERGLAGDDMESRGLFPFKIAKKIGGAIIKHKSHGHGGGNNNNNNNN